MYVNNILIRFRMHKTILNFNSTVMRCDVLCCAASCRTVLFCIVLSYVIYNDNRYDQHKIGELWE